MALHGPSATICVSETLAHDLARRSGRRVHFVPNGVQLCDESDDSILVELGLERERYILFVGRLVPEKGCHYLIDAWSRAGKPMPLVMAGDSSFSREYVEHLMRMCSDDKLLFPGYVYGARLASLFRNTALFVLPSDLEGLPIVLLEALGYGSPVLASDIPPNAEVLGNLGSTFPAGSVEALERMLRLCLADGEEGQRAKEPDAPRTRTNARAYSWPVVCRQTIDVYESIAGKPHELGST
jgi:glycosyltransferase involved in cell wall biosynthesis